MRAGEDSAVEEFKSANDDLSVPVQEMCPAVRRDQKAHDRVKHLRDAAKKS